MVEAQSLGPQPTEDFIQPFILEVPGLRGRLVRLGYLVDGTTFIAIFRIDGACVFFDKLLDDSQAEPGTLGLG